MVHTYPFQAGNRNPPPFGCYTRPPLSRQRRGGQTVERFVAVQAIQLKGRLECFPLGFVESRGLCLPLAPTAPDTQSTPSYSVGPGLIPNKEHLTKVFGDREEWRRPTQGPAARDGGRGRDSVPAAASKANVKSFRVSSFPACTGHPRPRPDRNHG